MVKNLFIRKKLKADFVEIDPEQTHDLKRHLGWLQLIVIGIGAIIGAGIFVITGTAAAVYAGPAIVLSFILASVICVFAGLCYAELASLIPIAGGSYSYTYVSLGEFPAAIMGWLLTGQYIFSAATVAAGWSGYLKSFLKDLGISISDWLEAPPFLYHVGESWSLSGSIIDFPAALLVLIIGVMISIGIKTVARFTSIMVVIKVSTILLFIALGIGYVEPSNWTPFIPENTGHFGSFGWSGIFRAAGLVFFAYIGFDTVSTLAHDAKDPQKDLPRGILGSLAVCTVAYILVSAILTGVVSYKELNVPDPIAIALNVMGPSFFWITSLVKIAILAGLASVVLIQLLGQTRILLAMGRDGLLPKAVGKIHPGTRTPLTATICTALPTMILASLFSVDILGQLVSIMTLLIFATVCLGVWILRHTHPEFPRSFRAPLVPLIPLLGIVSCLGQMLALPVVSWLQMLGWVAIGLIIYFSYGYRHSKIRIHHTQAK